MNNVETENITQKSTLCKVCLIPINTDKYCQFFRTKII